MGQNYYTKNFRFNRFSVTDDTLTDNINAAETEQTTLFQAASILIKIMKICEFYGKYNLGQGFEPKQNKLETDNLKTDKKT